MTAEAAMKSPKLLGTTILPSSCPKSNSLKAQRKGYITTPFAYSPQSPRLQALASPIGPCTPFSLESDDNLAANGSRPSTANVVTASATQTIMAQDKLDAAFTRHRTGEGKTYSSVLASKR